MFSDDVNTMFALAVLIICILILGFPIAFKLSPRIQRSTLFFNFNYPILPKFDNPEYYGLRGVHNVYISRWKNLKNEEDSLGASFISHEQCTTSQEKSEVVSLGTWFINHENHINSNAGVDQILEESTCPILLYLHGMACNRILPYENKYDILRKSFHVVAIDYRGFGDSSNDILSEDSLVEDAIQAYKWVKSKTDCDIYVWGHSLGSAIASRTVEQLSKTGHPIGLVLESSFPSLAEGVPYHPIAKYFSVLFYFKYTILDTLRDNGFTFNNSSFIENVDCPILIFHAEDDSVVPSFLGKQLYINTKKSRKQGQGPVAFHMIPALGYGHKDLITYSGMPVYISQFMRKCKEFKLRDDEVTDDYIKVYAAS